MSQHEIHRVHRTGRLRAAVMGANDGIVSTASLVIGVAAAGSSHGSVLLAGIAGLVAGAASMAAGEYVSVSSQADTEKADLETEQASLDNNREFETEELAGIYRARGLEPALANEVAQQLMAHDALGSHARDEIGISEVTRAQPLQAALYSGATFTVGAALPLIAIQLGSPHSLIITVALSSLLFLAILGSIAAKAGGAPVARGAMRVSFWGALAMILTALAGKLFEVIV